MAYDDRLVDIERTVGAVKVENIVGEMVVATGAYAFATVSPLVQMTTRTREVSERPLRRQRPCRGTRELA